MTMSLFGEDTRGAVFSPDRLFRYRLWRSWAREPRFLAVCGLNPSTADEVKDDPTIRRCMDFAVQWGFSGLLMVNMFAFRSTAPTGLLSTADPVGPDNDRHLADVAASVDRIMLAWGRHTILADLMPARTAAVFAIVRLHARGEVGTFGANADGSPKHPLYLPASTAFQPWGSA